MTDATASAALARLVSNVQSVRVSLSTEDPTELREAIKRIESARDALGRTIPQNEFNGILRESAVNLVQAMLRCIKQHQENHDVELLCRMADAINIVLGDEPPPPPPTDCEPVKQTPQVDRTKEPGKQLLQTEQMLPPSPTKVPVSPGKAPTDLKLLRRRSNSLSPGIIPGHSPLCSGEGSGLKTPSFRLSDSKVEGSNENNNNSSPPPDDSIPPPKFTGVRPSNAQRPSRSGSYLGEYRSGMHESGTLLPPDQKDGDRNKNERRSRRLSADFSGGISRISPPSGDGGQQNASPVVHSARGGLGLLGASMVASSAALSLGASPSNSPLVRPISPVDKEAPASLSKRDSQSSADEESHHILVPMRHLTIGVDDDDDKSKREYIEQEIVLSEQSYVDGLRILVEYYEGPLRQTDIIPMDQVDLLFGNVTELYQINKKLLSALTSGQKKTGEIFKEIIPEFEVYTKYGENFDDASALLQKLKKTNSDFRRFLAKQRSLHSDVVSLDLLDALLITPIQRLPRYNLLLSDLIKNTEEDHPDLACLKEALDMMLQISERVNERIKQSENIQKLQNIVRTIIFDTEDLKEETALVKPDRVFIREGDCQYVAIKKDSDKYDKKKKPAHLFLFNDLLVMTMRKRMTSYYLFRQAQDLSTGSAEKLYEDPTRMLLKNLHEPTAMLFFDSEEERDEWVLDIKRAHSKLDEQPKPSKHSHGTSSPGSSSKLDQEKREGSPVSSAAGEPGSRHALKSSSNPDLGIRSASSITLPVRDNHNTHAVPVPSPAPMPTKAKVNPPPPSPVPLPRSSMKFSSNATSTPPTRPLSQQPTHPSQQYSPLIQQSPPPHPGQPYNPRASYRQPKSPISAYNPHLSGSYGSAPTVSRSLSGTENQPSAPPIRVSPNGSARLSPGLGAIAPPPPFSAPNNQNSDLRPPGPAPPTRAQSFKQ